MPSTRQVYRTAQDVPESGKTKFPWPEWLESPEGKDAADFDTLTSGMYLQNRLWRAFMAGQEAGRKDALQETTNE